MAIGFLFGVAIAAPVAFVLGCICERDRRVSHEAADIRPALKRSIR